MSEVNQHINVKLLLYFIIHIYINTYRNLLYQVSIEYIQYNIIKNIVSYIKRNKVGEQIIDLYIMYRFLLLTYKHKWTTEMKLICIFSIFY